MNEFLYMALGTLVTLIIGGVYKAIASSIKKHVVVKSPESRSLEQLVPLVNMLFEVQLPIIDGLIAIMEAQKGNINGNIDSALRKIQSKREKLNTYMLESTKVE